MKKNQIKSLNSTGVSPVLVFALGWDSKKTGILGKLMGKKKHSDLDLSCAMYDNNDDRIDAVWYAQLSSKCGAIRHKGDDTVGDDETDDESMVIDMNQLNEQAKTLFFVVSSFHENGFSNVQNAYWRLFEGQSKREIARGDIVPNLNATAKIVMRLQKTEHADGAYEWKIKALDEDATGQNIQEVFPEIRALIEG